MSRSLIAINGVSKSFMGTKEKNVIHALNDISFSIAEGEYVCLLGRSGCGKSTLLSLIAGLISPDKGEITCKEQPIRGPDRHRMLMFQDAALFPWLDVMGNVLYGLNLIPDMTKAEKKDKASEWIELVGLSDFLRFRIHELSGGMRQRVAIARALAPNPDILLMDEPFSALDALTREQLYSDIQRIWSQTGKTILMVTHDVREAICLGTRVIILKAGGQIIADEPIGLPFPRGMNDTSLATTAAYISSFL